jgi:ubiquinone/menaquinone biosynthesis C-methylase UbiE
MEIRLKTTQQHKKFWSERKIDWEKDYLSTWNHPHRDLIIYALKSFNWYSLWEVGCGPGPNLMRITKDIAGKQLGGSDINADAIEVAKKTFLHGTFMVGSSEDLLMSDKAVDVVLSDACLIYTGPTKIKKTIKEFTRVARTAIVLCEFHGGSWWERLLFRIKTGYNAYDYRKLLEEAGCYDIKIAKIPESHWSGTPWSKWGHIIMANVI